MSQGLSGCDEWPKLDLLFLILLQVPQGSLPWSCVCGSPLGTYLFSSWPLLAVLRFAGALYPSGVFCRKIPLRIALQQGPLLIQRTLCLVLRPMEPPLLPPLDFSSVRQLPVLWLSRSRRHTSSFPHYLLIEQISIECLLCAPGHILGPWGNFKEQNRQKSLPYSVYVLIIESDNRQ